MGYYLINGQFQAGSSEGTRKGKVPLSIKDPKAQDFFLGICTKTAKY